MWQNIPDFNIPLVGSSGPSHTIVLMWQNIPGLIGLPHLVLRPFSAPLHLCDKISLALLDLPSGPKAPPHARVLYDKICLAYSTFPPI